MAILLSQAPGVGPQLGPALCSLKAALGAAPELEEGQPLQRYCCSPSSMSKSQSTSVLVKACFGGTTELPSLP